MFISNLLRTVGSVLIALASTVVATTASGSIDPSSATAAVPSQAQAIIGAAEKWLTSPVTPYCWDGGSTSGPTHGDGDSVEYYGPAGESGCSNSGPTSSAAGFDCTGLALYAVYQATGIELPHDSSQALTAVADGGQQITSESALLPGDLVYFGGTFADFIHVGIYIGNGNMVNAYDYMNDEDNGRNNKYWGVTKMSLSWETAGLAFVGGVRLWSAAASPPTVADFDASPATISSDGGTVTLSATVSSATNCSFTSNSGSVSGLADVPCSDGSVTDTVNVPANPGKRVLNYKFEIAVMGTKTVRATTNLTEALPVPHLTPLASTSGPAGFSTGYSIYCPTPKHMLSGFSFSSVLNGQLPPQVSSTESLFPDSIAYINTGNSDPLGTDVVTVGCIYGKSFSGPWKTDYTYPPVTLRITAAEPLISISPSPVTPGSQVTLSGDFGAGSWANSAVTSFGWITPNGTIDNILVNSAIAPSETDGAWQQTAEIPSDVPVGSTLVASASAYNSELTYGEDADSPAAGWSVG